jgi:DNA-binding transcriptional LysR family regulator
MTDEGLDDLALFVRIVELGSLSAASRALRAPKSSLSRRLGLLEQRLGTTLLQRRAKGLLPTSDGRLLYEQALPALRELSRAQEQLRQAHHGRGGLVRISAPPETGRAFLLPALAHILRENADLAVEVELSPRPVDLVAEGFDVVIRGGRVDDASLRVRLLFRIEGVLVASPRYLAERPAPASPEDLAHHRCLRLSTGPVSGFGWTLTHPRAGERVVSHPAALSVNDLDGLHLAAREGMGVARLPALLCAADLDEGRLIRVLPEWSGEVRPYYLANAGGRLPRRLRALLDALLAAAATAGGVRAS